MGSHLPAGPSAVDRNHCPAHVVADRSDQGRHRRCNGVIDFNDDRCLTRDGRVVAVQSAPLRPRAPEVAA